MDTTIAGEQVASRRSVSPQSVVALTVLVLFTIFITWRARVLEIEFERQTEEPAIIDKPAPDFSAVTPDGRMVSLGDFRGQKKVVISFWASWCGPCRLEMPGLIKFYEHNHTASSDFEFLAVSIDENPGNATAFASAQKLNFPVLLDPAQKMAKSYEVGGIPTLLVIDKNGKVTYGHMGYDAAMEYQLARALGIKPKTVKEGAVDGGPGH